MARENEADPRPVMAPAGSLTITASDSFVLQPYCHKLFIGNVQSGDQITLRLLDGSTPTLKFGQLSAFMIDVEFDIVFATGTTITASNIVGFYPVS